MGHSDVERLEMVDEKEPVLGAQRETIKTGLKTGLSARFWFGAAVNCVSTAGIV